MAVLSVLVNTEFRGTIIIITCDSQSLYACESNNVSVLSKLRFTRVYLQVEAFSTAWASYRTTLIRFHEYSVSGSSARLRILVINDVVAVIHDAQSTSQTWAHCLLGRSATTDNKYHQISAHDRNYEFARISANCTHRMCTSHSWWYWTVAAIAKKSRKCRYVSRACVVVYQAWEIFASVLQSTRFREIKWFQGAWEMLARPCWNPGSILSHLVKRGFFIPEFGSKQPWLQPFIAGFNSSMPLQYFEIFLKLQP